MRKVVITPALRILPEIRPSRPIDDAAQFGRRVRDLAVGRRPNPLPGVLLVAAVVTAAVALVGGAWWFMRDSGTAAALRAIGGKAEDDTSGARADQAIDADEVLTQQQMTG